MTVTKEGGGLHGTLNGWQIDHRSTLSVESMVFQSECGTLPPRPCRHITLHAFQYVNNMSTIYQHIRKQTRPIHPNGRV
jgi:hypothetical protein